MKRVLIISPYFPPTNAADMQRVRMSLAYYKAYNWEAEVVTVDERYSDLSKDELLYQSLPGDIKIHRVKALNKAWTSKLGLGSLALRSLWFYKQAVNNLLKNASFDLIYFSTTQFPVCILGAYWKKKFGLPYVIDIQDPWHSDYYRDKPKHQQPRKYWLSYHLNKYLEPLAMRKVNGLISVSQKYIEDVKQRYPELKGIPAATITFGAFAPDLQIAQTNQSKFKQMLDSQFINLVYIGRGGLDMHRAISRLFTIFKSGLDKEPAIFKKLKLHFIGTSYAPAGSGNPTVAPLAQDMGLESYVSEVTDRIGYYHTLATLQQADGLFIPGSDDPKYTGSKLYPYLLTHKPLLAILNPESPAVTVLSEFGVGEVYDYEPSLKARQAIYLFLKNLAEKNLPPILINTEAEKRYAAAQMTRSQCELFDKSIYEKN
ncbi:hypothetical protein [Mucilaginibacter panaciglaebae]|uniref:Glycosyltransferase subfamily 4-like N-terminal domain-containing protein n=1 Tax=Mucilaginibacter panaciglaebae TaxID=502331 RepID=A0ABP7WAY0_9SPHI